MTIRFIGAEIGACAGIQGCEKAPETLEGFLSFQVRLPYDGDGRDYNALASYFKKLGEVVQEISQHHTPFVIGGDHSCAIGTWSGISHFYKQKGEEIGLIWIDAHMDAHTPETTQSGNVHGMPSAILLGLGDPRLSKIFDQIPKIKPENIIFVGIRSFEKEEEEHLKKLGVKTYFMGDVKKHGIGNIIRSVYDDLSSRVKVGFTIDVDGFDPSVSPGTGTPVEDGIHFEEFLEVVKTLDLSRCAGVEITEYNPTLDHHHVTRDNVLRLIQIFEKTISL